ncbi:MAG: LysM peptidoglycan-binding domain-containing protein [Anaerolineales bacterium]|jgi:LysM repeat protein|nr:LysM peptidoglycan-binding domain-containing protein [Anaerolineales bacterium]
MLTNAPHKSAPQFRGKQPFLKTRISTLSILLLLSLFFGLVGPVQPARADVNPAAPASPQGVAAYDLILAMNVLRTSYGLPALIEDPIVNAVAQATADTMAAYLMSWHIGDVRGRLAAAGYGGGATVYATENFAVGHMSIDEIMAVWADPDHMRPAVVAAYCHVGAGVALAPNGSYYYVLQAAYTSSNSCGPYNYTGDTNYIPISPVSQLVMPVKIATPDAEGKIYHIVQAGQSLWAIAVAYQITIRDIEIWNNISRAVPLQTGQKLFIPTRDTEGYATPTPVGMIVPNTPAADGKIFHTVQSYQTLITISEAYSVTVDTLLALNGWQVDWPLQIGQELLISAGWVTPSPTPRPLTPIERLTPASDGKYYHTVHAGETLSWIAGLYQVALADLMAWNGLNNASIIQPDQKLLLQVTPPATVTNTPGPPTATATLTPSPRPPTATRTATPASPSPTLLPAPAPEREGLAAGWIFLIIVIAAGALFWIFRRSIKITRGS